MQSKLGEYFSRVVVAAYETLALSLVGTWMLTMPNRQEEGRLALIVLLLLGWIAVTWKNMVLNASKSIRRCYNRNYLVAAIFLFIVGVTQFIISYFAQFRGFRVSAIVLISGVPAVVVVGWTARQLVARWATFSADCEGRHN